MSFTLKPTDPKSAHLVPIFTSLLPDLDAVHFADTLGEVCRQATCLPTEDHLQGLVLSLVGSFVDEQPKGAFCCGPDLAVEAAHSDKAKAVQPNVAVVSLADVLSEHALTVIIG